MIILVNEKSDADFSLMGSTIRALMKLIRLFPRMFNDELFCVLCIRFHAILQMLPPDYALDRARFCIQQCGLIFFVLLFQADSMMSCPLPIVPVIQTLPTINSQPDYPIHIGIKVRETFTCVC